MYYNAIRAAATAALLTILLNSTSTATERPPDKRTATRSPAAIVAGADLKNPEVRSRVVEEMKAAEKVRYDAVLAKASNLGVPVRKEGPGHQVAILHDFRGDEPIYRKTMNLNAAISSGANLMAPAPYSLNGKGVEVGIWDAGSILRTHQEFTLSRVTNVNNVATDDHSTHVAGTIGAAGVVASARGMATNVFIDSYDWNDDYTEMTAAGAATATQTNKIPISNHSYGYNATTADMGVYNEESVAVDAILVGMPYYLPFWAAGNEQDELTAKGGYQSITYNGLAKNLITIGAVNDAVSSGTRNIANATMSTFSSWGPSDDGRIKPDIVANGVGVYSTINTGNTAYDSYNGTSMATPSAAGSSALLVQLYAREFSGRFMRASSLKALLIHTADDLGTAGPDFKFGWGLINTKAAADVILAHKASPGAPKLFETNLTTTVTTRSIQFKWDGSSPIRATLAWTDPAGTARSDNDRNPVLVNNLDLRIIGPTGTVYQPYVMPFSTNFTDGNFGTAAIKGSNRVDNVERVDIPAPSIQGTYTAVISFGGTLSGSAQNFSLVLTGSIGTDIPPQIAAIDPVTVVNGRAVAFAVTATDPADSDPITLTSANLPSGATFGATNGNGSFAWSSATPNGVYTPRFIATDKDGAVTQTVSITVVDNAPPVLAPVGDKITVISNLLTFAVSANDPIGSDPITLTASNLPVGATFSATNGNGTFTWANPSPLGVYPVTFTAGDMSGSSSETIYVTVKPVPVYVYGTNSTSITIPESGTASPYPSQITISGATGLVARVIVNINNYSHLYPADMDFVLVGPQGQKSVIMGGVGGSTAVLNLNLTFDDQAASEIPTPLASGTWKPSGGIFEALASPAPGLPYETSFTNFIGSSPNGTWSLYVQDYETPDNGTISGGWSLQVEVLVPTNTAPSIIVTNPAPVPVGSNFELPVTANDLTDNDVITLSADQLPPGAVFATVTNASTVTGTMVWNNAGPVGDYTAIFRATDNDGTRTINVPIQVFLPPPPTPASIWISATNNNGFTAEWSSSIGADSYRLDVSSTSAFETVSEIGTPTTVLYHSGTPGSGIGGTWIEQSVGGTTYLIMTSSSSRVTSPSVLFKAGVTDSLTFQGRTFGGVNAANNTITVSISTNAGSTWTVLGTRIPLSSTLSAMVPFDLSAYDGKQIAVKFETLGANGSVGAGIRQVDLKSLVYQVTPDFVAGYSNRTVNGTSEVVSGLVPGQTYYARVRAVNDGGVSANSSTASVMTTFSPEPPVFTSSAGPFTNQTGQTFMLPVSASGLPSPGFVLESTTASSGYSLAGSTLSYTPPLADVGVRTFTLVATNSAGAATQTVTVVVTEGPPPPPAAIWASITNATDFTASWSSVAGATSYRLDVATNATFAGAAAPAADLFLSEYIEGSSNNKAIEIFNGTGAPVNLSAAGYTLRLYFNGNTSFTTLALTGTVAAADVFVIAHSSANAAILAQADQTSGSLTHNGNDVIALAKGGVNIDVIGTIGNSANFAVDVTLVRQSTVNAGTTTYAPAEWTTQLSDTTSFLGSHSFAGGGSSPSYVPGYSNLTVAGTSQLVSGLMENRTYYFRARAVNLDGVSQNSPTGSVTTTTNSEPPPTAPAAPASIWASATNATEFTAAWSSVSTATSYRLDVSTNAIFAAGGVSTQSTLAFNPAMPSTITNNGWSGTSLTGSGYTTMLSTNSSVLSPAFSTVGFTNLTVDLRARTFGGANASANTITISMSTNNGAAWLVLGTVTPGSTTHTNMPTLTNVTHLGHAQTRIRWQTLGATGSVGAGLSNLTVRGWSSGGASSFVPGFADLAVAGTSQAVTGLTEGVTYYFRARAVNDTGTSPNSPTASVVTAASANPDSDVDGIPDQWELDNFGSLTNVNGTSDWDNDGFIDQHEFLAGTQPTNNASLLVVESGNTAPGSVVIQWQAVDGKMYRISRNTNLNESSYVPMVSNILGVSPQVTVTATPPDNANSAYRIELQ